MLDFANSQALKSKQTKATTASNIIKNVILVDLIELFSSTEIDVLQQAQQLIEDGKTRIQCLKEKRREEEKQRKNVETVLHEQAYNRALVALDGKSLAELYLLNVCFSYSSPAVMELIEEYDHQHYLASVQRWLDAVTSDDMHFEQSPEEVRDEWKKGIVKAAVEIISWPYLKYHHNYQESVATYSDPQGIPDDFPVTLYSTVKDKNQQQLTPACLNVIQTITVYEENEAKVRVILDKLGQ
ncbi:hypothetical protein [Photobacterium minamisatsumaniensis]|uniref:hypothetical protein n=1 Tax=Photobacterium minamisatsumaniensis TaxID=2910233 RepID=UPI003D125D86